MTAEIRPRGEWEAIDLGISLSRRHVKDLIGGWLRLVLPLCLLITLACYRQLGWAVFAMWWFKPLFERVVLFDLSRHLFGDKPTSGARRTSFFEQLKSEWLLIVLGVVLTAGGALIHGAEDVNPGFLMLFWLAVMGLCFVRSFITRSFTLPVRFLEGLKGAAFRKRSRLLSGRASGAAGSLTMIALLIEIGLFWSCALFVEIMLPAEQGWSVANLEDWGRLAGEMLTGSPDEFSLIFFLGVVGFYFIAMTVTAWIYVGGGFGLYLNTRTWTEGWDIELGFKRLAQRISLVLIALFFFTGSVIPARAADNDAGARLEKVLEHRDFKVHKTEKKRWVRDGEGWDLSWLGPVGYIIFWGMAVGLVILLVWLIVRNRHVFKPRIPELRMPERKKVTTVAGMDITPESLPDDVVAAARQLWLEGRAREAMSLLYRGAISWIVAEEVAEISESDTELDCVKRMRISADSPLVTRFETLTRLWMGTAYGGHLPQEDQLESVWSDWPFKGVRQGRRSS